MASDTTTFHRYTQDQAFSIFPSLLEQHLPHSNPIYNRILSPSNLPSRHCLFAATFPPTSLPAEGDTYTIIFSDRSRHSESQIWVFNPVIVQPDLAVSALSEASNAILPQHLHALIRFLKDTEIPEAPGWPFSSTLRFGCLHQHIADALTRVCEQNSSPIEYATTWNQWLISTTALSSPKRETKRRSLPDGFTVGRVPEDQLDVVIANSAIPRQAATLLALPSVALLKANENENEAAAGTMVAWGYVGIDGGFATLHVLPEYRGRGLATYVAEELLGRLGQGSYADLGFDGRSRWAHADVHAGNAGSEGVMRALGSSIAWTTQYLRVESDRF